MKAWKTIIAEDYNLEDALNTLEKSGVQIKEVIPYYSHNYDQCSQYVTEYKIIYTVEEETNE